MTENDSVIA